MKFAVVGTGYVGLSLSLILSKNYRVVALDIDEKKVDMINNNLSPIKDDQIQKFFKNEKLNLNATTNKVEAFEEANFIIIATPTNYSIETGSFDTKSVENVIADAIKINKKSTIVIKSTVPPGFTDQMKKKFNKEDLFFSPEFLRETKSIYDNIYPSRIIVGGNNEKAKIFAEILVECSGKDKNDLPVIFMSPKEAEAVKLFSNTFLAMRISFFNELDTFSEFFELDTELIIKGVCSDPRIGDYYNNPSFGYGGYCLPKDTQQLLENFNNVPNNIIKAVVESNKTRKEFIAESIMKNDPKTVGIYRLIMKKNSDNFRESAVIDIIKLLKDKNIEIVLFEPFAKGQNYEGIRVIENLKEFISTSDIIVANRLSDELEPVISKVYTRDLFQEN